MAIARLLTTTIASVILISSSLPGLLVASQDISEADECQVGVIRYPMLKTVANGRKCEAEIEVAWCTGYCESYEIGDYKFPYKEHKHHVCVPTATEIKTAVLECEGPEEPRFITHEYHEPIKCKCALCNTSNTLCEGMKKKSSPPRSKPAMNVEYDYGGEESSIGCTIPITPSPVFTLLNPAVCDKIWTNMSMKLAKKYDMT